MPAAALRAVPPPTPPILVVDDDAKIVALVRTYLEREGFRVVTARDGAEALTKIRTERPRLVVLDVMLPEVDGLAVTRRVRQESDVPILMLSARGAVADRIQGLAEGADDYVAKPFSPAELVVRVKAVLRRASADGTLVPTRGALTLGDLTIDLDRHQVERAGHHVGLTPIEFRLLATLAGTDGRVLSRDQLLDAVYGSAAEVLDRTIDVHIARLREKLGDDAERPRYIAAVRGEGYRSVTRPLPSETG